MGKINNENIITNRPHLFVVERDFCKYIHTELKMEIYYKSDLYLNVQTTINKVIKFSQLGERG